MELEANKTIPSDEERLLNYIRSHQKGEVTLRSVSEAIGMSTNQVNMTAKKLEDKSLIKIKKNDYGRIRGFDVLEQIQ